MRASGETVNLGNIRYGLPAAVLTMQAVLTIQAALRADGDPNAKAGSRPLPQNLVLHFTRAVPSRPDQGFTS